MTPRAIGSESGFAYLLGGSASGSLVNFDFTTGILPGGITFTRASTGTYNSSGGILERRRDQCGPLQLRQRRGVPADRASLRRPTSSFTPTDSLTDRDGLRRAALLLSLPRNLSPPDGTNDGSSLTAGSGFGSVGNYTVTFANAQYTVSAWVKRIIGSAPHLFKFEQYQLGW